MAFFATLGLSPGLLVLGGLLGWLDTLAGSMVSERAEAAAVEFLDRVLTERGAGFVAAVRDLFDRERVVVVVSGLLLGIWTMSRGFVTAIQALDLAHDVHGRDLAARMGMGPAFFCSPGTGSSARSRWRCWSPG